MVCSWIISMCGLFAAHSSLATCENLYTLSKYTNRLLCMEGCQILYALSLSTLVAREYLFLRSCLRFAFAQSVDPQFDFELKLCAQQLYTCIYNYTCIEYVLSYALSS